MKKRTVYEYEDEKYRIPKISFDTGQPGHLTVRHGFGGDVSVQLEQLDRFVRVLRKAKRRAKKHREG